MGNKIQRIYVGESLVYPSPQSLLSNVIAYYPMAGDLKDTSGNGYDLTALSGAVFSGGAEYNTVSNFWANNGSLVYNTTASATISMWANKTNTGGVMFVLGDDLTKDGAGWGFQLRDTITYVVISGSAYNTTAITKPTGWHMYSAVFNYSAHTLSYYVDGVLQNTKTGLPNAGLRGGTKACIGTVRSQEYVANNVVEGDIGITFATQNAMSATELLKFYNATKGKYLGV